VALSHFRAHVPIQRYAQLPSVQCVAVPGCASSISSHSACVRLGTALSGASPVTIIQQPFGAAAAETIDRVFFALAFAPRSAGLAFGAALRAGVFRVFFGDTFEGFFDAFDGFFTSPSVKYTPN